jgi:predicted RNA binding protein YcfA (HicA-like mRNA interferase family)
MSKLPGVSYLRAVTAFEKVGFWVLRQGKHTSMTNGDRIIVIPRASPIDAFTMGGIIKDAGLTVEEFKKLLK